MFDGTDDSYKIWKERDLFFQKWWLIWQIFTGWKIAKERKNQNKNWKKTQIDLYFTLEINEYHN